MKIVVVRIISIKKRNDSNYNNNNDTDNNHKKYVSVSLTLLAQRKGSEREEKNNPLNVRDARKLRDGSGL